MVIYKAKNYQDLSRKAANIISAQTIMKPDVTLEEAIEIKDILCSGVALDDLFARPEAD